MFYHALPVLLLLFVAQALRAADAELPDSDTLPAKAELPDPLEMLRGGKVTTAEQWTQKRRPELKRLFQYYMYGYPPPPPDKVEARLVREDARALDGKATLRELDLTFGPSGVSPIHLLLVVPNERKGPAPVFVGINFYGNHTLLPDPKIRLPEVWVPPGAAGASKEGKASAAGRGAQVETWALDQAVARGYAVASFYTGDIKPDRANFSEGIHAHYLKPGQTAPGAHDWGTIAAWAWGIQRVVDHLVSNKDLDSRRICVVGHSRLGKTALLAAAFDERIKLAIPSQAGCGGTAPSRGKVGESVKQINDRFPHWFNGTFKEFNDKVERLPFDQHSLVALVAPRPVLFSNAVEDSWANPAGQFEVLKAAEPVYRLLGAGGLAAKAVPEPGVLVDSVLGYYIRPGKHSMTRGDWKVFLDYADKRLAK